MEKLGNFVSLGDELHILGGYCAELNYGDRIDHNRGNNCDCHADEHIQSARRRHYEHTAIVNGVSDSTHDKTRKKRTDKNV